ncbi:hypothetical protein ALC60_02874 [Trachymyrmex zeteki]|uniref:Uncharacterized protein n=1 Tax=Mycetomoellerius zeteki TaxID=64791 RepID=A0A151XCP7_9HYME|nr:hypothetical protein ALC60_02874 [Trachymyrmex zeteki]
MDGTDMRDICIKEQVLEEEEEEGAFAVSCEKRRQRMPRHRIRLPMYVTRMYMYERIRIPTKAIPTPTTRDKEMHTLDGRSVQGDKRISISTSFTKDLGGRSLPPRSKPIAQWFTASRTFEDGGYSVTWLTEVEVAPREKFESVAGRERMNGKREGGWRGREASVDRRGYESNSSEVVAVERSAEQLIQS